MGQAPRDAYMRPLQTTRSCCTVGAAYMPPVPPPGRHPINPPPPRRGGALLRPATLRRQSLPAGRIYASPTNRPFTLHCRGGIYAARQRSRRGQDPSLQAARLRRTVGSGLDRSVQPRGCRNVHGTHICVPLQTARAASPSQPLPPKKLQLFILNPLHFYNYSGRIVTTISG